MHNMENRAYLDLKKWWVEKGYSVSQRIMLDLISVCYKTKTQSLKIYCERMWVCTWQHAAWPAAGDALQPLTQVPDRELQGILSQ